MHDDQLLSVLDAADPAGAGPDGPLFDERSLAALAAIPSAEQKLLALARDERETPARRFAAAEALAEGAWEGWRSTGEGRAAVARALVEAMAGDRSHNRWGLPGAFVGPFGRRLLSLGEGAEAALLPLLDDARPLSIEGSEAATINSRAGYRVADLAAWLLASSRGLAWRDDPDPRARDEEIARVRSEFR